MPENYRPITILSCIGKVFTSVLNDRLTSYVENNEPLLKNQARFRKKQYSWQCFDIKPVVWIL